MLRKLADKVLEADRGSKVEIYTRDIIINFVFKIREK